MHFFISYAKADTFKLAFALFQAMNRLPDVTAWMDEDLTVGEHWAEKIEEEIDRSDYFIVLLSPDVNRSAKSPKGVSFVRKEIERAQAKGIPIIPIMAQATDLPILLGGIQYITATDFDFQNPTHLDGLISEIFEHRTLKKTKTPPTKPKSLRELTAEFEEAYDNEAWETAHGLLEQIRATGQTSKIFEQSAVKKEKRIHTELANLTQQREEQARREAAEFDYDLIRKDFRRESHEHVWSLLVTYYETYGLDYDFDHLGAKIYTYFTRQILGDDLFEWCHIPSGRVKIAGAEDSYVKTDTWFEVPAFWIAKYPTTNAQYAPFVKAGGYEDQQWWTRDGWQARLDGWAWESSNGWVKKSGTSWTEPRYWQDAKWNGARQPSVGISWYESVAFSQWLGAQTPVLGGIITLPTEQQWQRAAQGDDERIYPWGNDFDKSRCNIDESGIHQTTPVTQYPQGASPYGVLDMAGNVWEWCLTDYSSGGTNISFNSSRVLRGGSWFNTSSNARAVSRSYLNPYPRGYVVGFRVLRGSPFNES